MADPPPKFTRTGPVAGGPYAMPTAPYGINRGTCDRGQLARDMANDARLSRSRFGESDRNFLVNTRVGRDMDATDQACIGRILEYAPDRAAIRWYGASTSAYGGPAYAVTPLRTFEHDGRFCREFQTVVTFHGETDQSYAIACRMPDGVWRTAS